MFLKNYSIYILTLVSLLSFGNGAEIKTFKGSINDKHVIKMTLNIKKNGEIVGYYYYENQKINIPLHGKIIDDQIELAENIEFSGRFSQGFKGIIANDEIRGVWADSIKKRKFKFALALETRNVPDKKYAQMDGQYTETESDSGQTRKLKLHYVSANLFKFQLIITGTNACTGFVSGLITFKNNKAIYKDAGCDLLEFTWVDQHIKVSESNCEYHGMQCEFTGEYLKNAN